MGEDSVPARPHRHTRGGRQCSAILLLTALRLCFGRSADLRGRAALLAGSVFTRRRGERRENQENSLIFSVLSLRSPRLRVNTEPLNTYIASAPSPAPFPH